MIDVQNLDRGRNLDVAESELLNLGAENVRTFYSLTGPARKDYTIQMAEAEAERIRIIRQAQADGLLAIRKAEAEGFRLVGEALAKCQEPELVLKLAGLATLQDAAKALADGRATKLFLPQNMGDIFSLVGGWKEILNAGTPSVEQQTQK
jgi:ActR/RegA family two-component response regulator